MTASAAPGKVPELISSSMKEMVCLNSIRFFILEPGQWAPDDQAVAIAVGATTVDDWIRGWPNRQKPAKLWYLWNLYQQMPINTGNHGKSGITSVIHSSHR